MYWPVLILGAALTLFYVLTKIRHNQLETSDAVFWFFFALILIIIAVFPQIAYMLSSVLGIESPANFMFLCILAVVIYRLLTMSAENARLRNKIIALTQVIALSQTQETKDD